MIARQWYVLVIGMACAAAVVIVDGAVGLTGFAPRLGYALWMAAGVLVLTVLLIVMLRERR